MKIAAGLISILFSAIIFLQSFVVSVGGGILNDKASAEGGAVGILVALLFFVAGAFAFALPKVAMVVSMIAGLFAFMNWVGGNFPDMGVWAFLALCLAALEFYAGRKPKIKTESQEL